MKDSDVREMFVKWLKATSWHPCGVEYLITQDSYGGDRFGEPIESIYQGYAAGIRKGMRIQKEKQKNASKL